MHLGDSALPRAVKDAMVGLMTCLLEVRSHLSPEAQATFIEAYNSSFDKTKDAIQAEQAAWQAIHDQYDEDEAGTCLKAEVIA